MDEKRTGTHEHPTEPPVRVRPAIRTDIYGIVEAASTSVDEGEDIGFGSPSPDSPFTDPERLGEAWQEPNVVRGEEIIVAEIDGHTVGFATLEDRGEDLELVNIDVARAFQQQGIGTRIVRYVEERSAQEGKHGVTLGPRGGPGRARRRSAPRS